jgi:hypothetical protein
MRPALMRLMAFLALILAAPLPGLAQRKVALDVDLEKLQPEDWFGLLRSVLPDSHDPKAAPLDLAAAVRLSNHLPEPFRFGHSPEKRAAAARLRQTLDQAMRRSLAHTDLDSLRRLALGDGEQDPGQFVLRPVLYQRWIEAEVGKICAIPKLIPVFPADSPPLPSNFYWRPESPEETARWQRVVGPFSKRLTEIGKQKPRGLMAEGGAYEKLRSAILLERNEKVADELLRFDWDATCGFGIGEFQDDRMTLVFLGLLRERRIAEAVGASFYVPDSPEWTHEPGQPFDQWRVIFLTFCGVEAEDAMLATKRDDFLAATRSEKAAQRLLQVLTAVPQAPFHKRIHDLEKAIPFLVLHESFDGKMNSPFETVSAKMQAALLTEIGRTLRDDAPFSELDALLPMLEKLRRIETKDLLHRLLQHPSTTYAEQAAAILRRFGEEIPPIAPAPPVRFRICLNDQPWRLASLSCQPLDATWSALGTMTDGEGMATLPRDLFLDPGKRATRLKFFHIPFGSPGTSNPNPAFDAPWVSAEVAVPKALDEVTTVRLEACVVPGEIAYLPLLLGTAKTATVIELRKAGPANAHGPRFRLSFDGVDRPAPRKFTLSTIAPGSYQLFVSAPGSARHLSQPFEVKPGMEPIRLKLEKGWNVSATLWRPANARGAEEIQLLRDGEDVSAVYGVHYDYIREINADPHAPLFAGVPKGKYRLRILSSAEFKERHAIEKWQETVEIDGQRRIEVDGDGVSVDFTVDEKSPPIVDLGRLENKPVAAMRQKAGAMIEFRPK